MKRGLALILTLVLAPSLLAGCELMVPGPTECFTIEVSGEPLPTRSTEPTMETYGFTVFPKGNYLADAKFGTLYSTADTFIIRALAIQFPMEWSK